ncbi:MAG: signal peptidase I [Clostridia bacterium]|nr:signal peptidase I [Clostridia bacterium]
MGGLLKQKPRPFYKDPLVIVIVILTFILLCRILFAVNYRGVYIVGSSMNPTLYDGDFVYISVYGEPDYGDIVVLETDGEPIIKRVIAMGGDSVYMQQGVVYIMYEGEDGYTALEEDYLSSKYCTLSLAVNSFDAVYVPEGYIFVLGDNRDNSKDSRSYGCFSLSSVDGVVTEWSLKYKDFFTAVYG